MYLGSHFLLLYIVLVDVLQRTKEINKTASEDEV